MAPGERISRASSKDARALPSLLADITHGRSSRPARENLEGTNGGTAETKRPRFLLRIGARDLVPHTGIAANLRRVPTEYGCYGGLWPAPVGSGRFGGTGEGS